MAPEIYEVLKKYDSEGLVPFCNACKSSILGEHAADTHTDTADEDKALEQDATNSDAAMPDTIPVPATAPIENLHHGDPPLVLPATLIDENAGWNTLKPTNKRAELQRVPKASTSKVSASISKALRATNDPTDRKKSLLFFNVSESEGVDAETRA
ncbi:unnamed protein product [Dibothriocephalus latus]|uniref:Uncharacterized protein n=1 Tax=Dibothriocephalus latus TaxID=60516 RepID=A0A3P7NJG7_DIBLA|nr:unnamed protein product [Dibothriocephalus latus]